MFFIGNVMNGVDGWIWVIGVWGGACLFGTIDNRVDEDKVLGEKVRKYVKNEEYNTFLANPNSPVPLRKKLFGLVK